MQFKVTCWNKGCLLAWRVDVDITLPAPKPVMCPVCRALTLPPVDWQVALVDGSTHYYITEDWSC